MGDLIRLIDAHPFLFFLLILWSLAWKGIALWRSARREDTAWFIALLVVNTLGILEMLYLFLHTAQSPEASNRTI
ncbi:MAG: hypothetical protein HY460_01580 [Parcubacteria group bacterium]|nr:hypothetical protein [Parcubacteria group bacterium]